MSKEQLNTALCNKMQEEQSTYRSWLLTQAPEEILNHTLEYSTREDIVMAMEFLDLPEKQAAALLAFPFSPGGCVQGLPQYGYRAHG